MIFITSTKPHCLGSHNLYIHWSLSQPLKQLFTSLPASTHLLVVAQLELPQCLLQTVMGPILKTSHITLLYTPLYSPRFGRYSIHYFPHRFPSTPYVFPDQYLITSQLVSPLATSRLQPVPLLSYTCPDLPCTFPTIPPSAGNPPHLRGWALITPSLLGSRFTWSTHIASLKSLPTVEAPVSLVSEK